jgi:hypothetical protein
LTKEYSSSRKKKAVKLSGQPQAAFRRLKELTYLVVRDLIRPQTAAVPQEVVKESLRLRVSVIQGQEDNSRPVFSSGVNRGKYCLCLVLHTKHKSFLCPARGFPLNIITEEAVSLFLLNPVTYLRVLRGRQRDMVIGRRQDRRPTLYWERARRKRQSLKDPVVEESR